MSSTAYSETPLPVGTRAGWGRSYSRISWGAVLAGAAVAAATMVLLSLLGVAIGANGMRFIQTSASDLKSYGVGAGIWIVVNVALSMAFGGYVASRLSGTHSHLDGELHGITVWAVALLLTTVLLSQAASLVIGGVTPSPGVTTGGSGSPTGTLTQQVSPQALVDRLQQSLISNGDPTQMTRDQIRSEIAALTGRRVLNGSFSDQDRDRLTALVAAQAGVTREEAVRRVAQMEQDTTASLAQAEQQARAAAETAASAAAIGAKAIAAALILGLGAAMLGAWLGTRHARVLTPHEPAYDTHTTTVVTHTAYEPPVTRTAYEPQVAPESMHVYRETDHSVPEYLQGLRFPATKQDLLRAARTHNDEPAVVRQLEQIANRNYASLEELIAALGRV
jgi:Protein of unknown function (DUF2795)